MHARGKGERRRVWQTLYLALRTAFLKLDEANQKNLEGKAILMSILSASKVLYSSFMKSGKTHFPGFTTREDPLLTEEVGR